MKKRLALLGVAALLLPGCARFSTKQTDTSYDTNGQPARAVTTKASAWTLLSSKSELANFKANQTDKTQSATVGSLTQQGGTNVVAVLENISKIVQAVK